MQEVEAKYKEMREELSRVTDYMIINMQIPVEQIKAFNRGQ